MTNAGHRDRAIDKTFFIQLICPEVPILSPLSIVSAGLRAKNRNKILKTPVFFAKVRT
jgi:hypothetical protein